MEPLPPSRSRIFGVACKISGVGPAKRGIGDRSMDGSNNEWQRGRDVAATTACTLQGVTVAVVDARAVHTQAHSCLALEISTSSRSSQRPPGRTRACSVRRTHPPSIYVRMPLEEPRREGVAAFVCRIAFVLSSSSATPFRFPPSSCCYFC